jgi:hypothetical protein
MNNNHERAWEISADVFFDHTNKPHFIDGCGHKPEEYLGTFRYFEGKTYEKKWADVYVHTQHGGQHVCIRTGDEPWDYASVGTVLDLLTSQTCRLYQHAAALIDLKMRVRFERV